MNDVINDQLLQGQTVLITGAARRLGNVMAMAVAKAGGDVIIHYNESKKQAEELASAIQQIGPKAWIISADMSSEKGLRKLCEEAFSFSPVTTLINNASIFKNQTFFETSLPTWKESLLVNFTAPFYLSQSFARQMIDGKKGRILNMVDWRALRPGADHFAYSISKAALVALTKSMALSLAPTIAVNAIALGAILPPEDEEQDPAILKKVPLKRWAKLDELGNLVLYLLGSPVSLTGQVIHLDGGRHLIH